MPHAIVGAGGADNATYTSCAADHPEYKYPSYARVRTHPWELSANTGGVHVPELPADTNNVQHKLVHELVDVADVNHATCIFEVFPSASEGAFTVIFG